MIEGASNNVLGSGGKLPGSRAMRIESRKGILSRKSSVNKNSFYKQKSKDALPNKLYGAGSPGGITGMGTLSGVNRGASSYFNKNNPSGGGVNLPNITGASGISGGGMGSSAIGANRSKIAPGMGSAGYPSYKYKSGGLGGGIGGGFGSGIGGGIGSDPYAN